MLMVIQNSLKDKFRIIDFISGGDPKTSEMTGKRKTAY